MEQRPLRLGDIVDDYCPRERRITNHVIAVMNGADIHSTRCSVCESEHPYKKAKAPLRRSAPQDTQGGHLVKSVHEGPSVEPTPQDEVAVSTEPSGATEPSVSGELSVSSEPESTWTHRPLIRAALPKGMVPAAPRPLPDFTMRNIRNRDGRDGRSNGRRFSR